MRITEPDEPNCDDDCGQRYASSPPPPARVARRDRDPGRVHRLERVVPLDAAYQQAALKLTQSLRHDGYTVDLAFSGNGRKRMRRADKLGACAAVLLGEDEMAKSAVKVRDLDSGEETLVALDTLSAHLARYA